MAKDTWQCHKCLYRLELLKLCYHPWLAADDGRVSHIISRNILTPTLMAVNVVSFSFFRCSIGGPATQLCAGWWLSLMHLISNFSGPQTPSGFQRPLPQPDVAFPTTLVYNSVSNCNWNSSGAPKAPSAWCGCPYYNYFWPGRRSKYHNHPLIIFQNSTCGIFFTFVSSTLAHIFTE